MSGVLNVSNSALSRDNQPKELSLRQNDYYLKQFDSVCPTSFISLLRCSHLMFFLSSLAQPHSTRRHRGCYASRVFTRSACSNSTGGPYRQKEDNHIIWFNLGDRINSPICIYRTSPGSSGCFKPFIDLYFRIVKCSWRAVSFRAYLLVLPVLSSPFTNQKLPRLPSEVV